MYISCVAAPDRHRIDRDRVTDLDGVELIATDTTSWQWYQSANSMKRVLGKTMIR